MGVLCLAVYWRWLQWRAHVQVFRRCAKTPAVNAAVAIRRKPDWVVQLVICLAVYGLNCRKIADNFNRRFGRWITIGKSWVALVLKAHADEIADKRRTMRRRPPIPFVVNRTWALDMSFYTSPAGVLYAVLGIIDDGSRRLLCLKQLPRKCTLTLLGHLFLTMARHPPVSILRYEIRGAVPRGAWRRGASLRRMIRPSTHWDFGGDLPS